MRNLILLIIVIGMFSACSAGTKNNTSISSGELKQEKDSSYIKEIRSFQDELNDQFRDPEYSPLLSKDLQHFEQLEFYAINSKFNLNAEFERTPNEEPFDMPTTTERKPRYVKYGIATFTLQDDTFSLNIYQNLGLIGQEGYEDYLFLPFTDATNSNGSYGGGRYIDLRIPTGKNIRIDFNKAYNPYCAYSHKYSCPIPPTENDLNIRVEAGVKAFDDH